MFDKQAGVNPLWTPPWPSLEPSRFEPATGNPRLNGVIVDADAKTGRALAIRRVSFSEQELTELAAGAGTDLHARTRVPALSEPAGRVEG